MWYFVLSGFVCVSLLSSGLTLQLVAARAGVVPARGLRPGIILSEKYPLSESNRVVTKVDDRIVGGEEADIKDFPHQISFTVNNSYFCGGSIISDRHILTAGHCAQNVDPSTVELKAGSSFRKNGTIIRIIEVVAHPDYDKPPYDHDVAYMKTAEPIKFSETMQPIALPPVNRGLKGEIVVSGWGRTEQDATKIPNRLMKVKLPVVNYWLCLFSYLGILTKNMVCAGNFFLGGKGTCQGDSGGAAIQDGMVVGVVSFGKGCAAPLAPGVFAAMDAPENRNFILKNTGV